MPRRRDDDETRDHYYTADWDPTPDHSPDPPPDDQILDRFVEEYEIITTIRPRGAAAGRAPSPAPVVASHDFAAGSAAILPPPPPPVALPPPAVPHPDPIPGIIPAGSICTLSGASGVGKTALIAGWVRCWQSGTPICGHEINQLPAIGMIASDRPWRDHGQWFAKAGCDEIPHYSLHDDDSFNWDSLRDWRAVPTQFAMLVDRLALPPGALLIVDPLPLFIPGKLIDYKDAAIGMAHIGKIIRARQLTLLGVFHVAKEKGNRAQNYLRPQDRILGSGGQIGYSETAIYLMAPDEAGVDYYQVGWVPHQRPAECFKLERDGNGLFTEFDTISAEATRSKEVDTVVALMLPGTIHMASALTKAIMAGLNCQERKAKGLITEACHRHRVIRVGRGAYQLTG